MTIQQTLNEREQTHGKYDEHASITQCLKDTLHHTDGWDLLSPSQKETLEMTAHKIGRILAGNPNTTDHWVDICGYNQLIVNQLEEDNNVVNTQAV